MSNQSDYSRVRRANIEAAVAAAERLLAAREDEMLTSEEWDELQQAVAACREPDPSERDESFRVDPDGALVRCMVPRRGDPYEHRCSRETLLAVAWGVEEFSSAGRVFVLEDLRRHADVPWSQAAAAFAFMKERGVIVPAGGRSHRASNPDASLDVQIEYEALRAGAPGALPARGK